MRLWPRFSSCQRATAARHSPGISESTEMRARTSSPRLLSCVEVADIECVRLAAHLVQRGERVVAVKGRVFEALRRDGAGQLLEAQHELAPLAALFRREAFGVFEQQHGGDEVEDR